MVDIMGPYYGVQLVNTVLGIALNLFLVYIVVHYSGQNIGNYKYLICSFALFEVSFAIVVWLGMPLNVIADQSWMVFSKSGLLSDSPWPVLGPGLYCTFYEIWIGFVVLHFIYRYVVVCQADLCSRIILSTQLKALVTLICVVYMLYCCLCGLYFCTRLEMTHKLSEDLHQRYNIDHPERMGYILLRVFTEQGEFSVAGTTTIANHFLLVTVAISLIGLCGISIWRKIRKLEKDSSQLKEHSVQKQLFMTLVIQTLVPVIFCHIPTVIFVSFPLFQSDFNLGEWSLLFSFLTSVNKWVDPIIVIVCIRNYRKAAFNTITCRSKISPHQQNSSSNQHTTVATRHTE